jgi:hypothetical protein
MSNGKQFLLKAKRSLVGVVATCYLLPAICLADATAADMEDPLYIQKLGDFTSKTSFDFGNYFRAREIAGYGFSDRFSVDMDIRYRSGGDDERNGFSNLGLMGKFRAGSGNTGATDILFGFGFGGQGVVPNYSDEVYSVGLRTGKQWSGVTLAATVLTNWMFKDYGMAYIDLSPEAYFQTKGKWSLSLGATLRKATSSAYDQEWVNMKFGVMAGWTGWYANVGYEIESNDIRVGGSLNMLF